MELSKVVAFLRKFAPIELAEAWDNVGLLLEPSTCRVEKILLTNDLTEPVLEEAVKAKANLIVSYHPPLFSPIKRLCQDSWKSRIITRCLENRIAVYSPHTSWDHVKGGVNDWLAKAFSDHPSTMEYIDTLKGSQAGLAEAGIGRKLTMDQPIFLDEAVGRVKNHLNLPLVRLAKAYKAPQRMSTIGICAGSGSSVMQLAPPGTFDLILTGEMSHHDTLNYVQNGTSVILCEHSNTERGFLHEFQDILKKHLGVTAIVSKLDVDPLKVI